MTDVQDDVETPLGHKNIKYNADGMINVDIEAEFENSRPLSELLAKGYRRWYQFGLHSPSILYRRLRNKYTPIRRWKWRRQRARNGYADNDVWGLHSYLAEVIIGSVAQLREIAHGHPVEISFEEWIQILQEIENGMRASQVAEQTGRFEEGGEEEFALAFAHMQKWWYGLWD